MSNPTPILLETIRIEDGTIHHLDYHQKRFDTSRQALYDEKKTLLLKEHIIAPTYGLYQCRILYHTQIYSIEYIPYKAKKISKLQIVESSLSYTYKYADRTALHTLIMQYPHADDILILKEGMITDTTIANIAFYDGNIWFTPRQPLLKGTMRSKLMDEGFLTLKDIYMKDLPHYTHVALMNAMIGFKILKNMTIFDTKGKHYDY